MTWSHSKTPEGVYVLSVDGVEVGSVAWLPSVRRQHDRVVAIVELLNRFDGAAAVVGVPAAPDWRALGWRDRGAHDRTRGLVTSSARRLPEPVQEWLRREWGRFGFSWPLSRDEMEIWARTVRVAPSCFEQDEAAEAPHAQGGVAA